MKRTICALASICIPVALAAPNKDFSSIVQNFAQQENLIYQSVSQLDKDGRIDKNRWTYLFSASPSCQKNCSNMLVTFEYIKQGQPCVWKAGLFGDLPLSIGGQPALFSVPILADPTSRAMDTLDVDDGKGGCYTITYGFNGDKFERSVKLAKQLLGK